MKLFKSIFLTLTLVLTVIFVQAQEKSDSEKRAEYKQVVTQRADKIVKALGLTDIQKSEKVRDIIAQQYIDLNAVHDTRNARIKNLKQLDKENKEKTELEIKRLEDEADAKLAKLHKKYISKLNSHLSDAQVEMVKDGMTYGVLPLTYNGYLQMLPGLTDEQKRQILVYLTEARERAMDAESSEKKHAWFGKYKGKINNYLSAAGIDMNKASKEWQQRLKEGTAKSKND